MILWSKETVRCIFRQKTTLAVKVESKNRMTIFATKKDDKRNSEILPDMYMSLLKYAQLRFLY